MKNLSDYIPIALSLLPLIFRAVINFAEEEKAVTNNRKYLLNQIRIALSMEFSKSLQFEDSIVQIDDDFRSKLRENMNDFLYTNTLNLTDFNRANRKSKNAINWIRVFKYSLVTSTFLSFALYILAISSIELRLDCWYNYFLGLVFILIMVWFCKERSVDTFNNMCVKYEIER
jgi:hypothetical protein